MNLFNSKFYKWTSNEEKVLHYFNDFPTDVLKLSIQRLAEKINVSTPTISRVTRKMGFYNFKELKKFISIQLSSENNQNTYTKDIEVMNRISSFYQSAITLSNNQDVMMSISRLKNRINFDDRCIVMGWGASSLAAQNLANNLNKINLTTFFSNDIHQLISWVSLIEENKKNKLIIFSHSLSTIEIKNVIEIIPPHLHKNIWIITSISSNENIFKDVNLILYGALNQTKRYTALTSKITQLFISDIIFLEIINKNEQKNYSLIDFSTKLFNLRNKK